MGALRRVRLVAQDARLSLAQHGFNSRTRRHAPPGGSGTDATNVGKAVRFRRGVQLPLPADRRRASEAALRRVRLLAGAPQGATNGRSPGSYPGAQANPVRFRTLQRRRRSERARFHTALARAFDSHRRHSSSSLVQWQDRSPLKRCDRGSNPRRGTIRVRAQGGPPVSGAGHSRFDSRARTARARAASEAGGLTNRPSRVRGPHYPLVPLRGSASYERASSVGIRAGGRPGRWSGDDVV